jgi:hypothetical protein
MIDRAVHEELDHSNPMPFISTYSPIHPNFFKAIFVPSLEPLAGADPFWMQTARAAK